MIRSPRTFTLNSTSYTEITLGDIGFADGFSIYVVDSSLALVSFYFATDEAGTDETPAPAAGLEWDGRQLGGETVVWVKATEASCTLVLRVSEK